MNKTPFSPLILSRWLGYAQDMRRLPILLLLLYTTLLPAAVYKWVDNLGQIHYSDQPAAGAEKIVLPEPTTYSPRIPVGTTTSQTSKKKAALYERFSITSPEDQTTFRGKERPVTVKLASSPGLQVGHAIRLVLNGRVVKERLLNLQFTLGAVDRGSHRLEASIIDIKGREQISATPVRFHYHVDLPSTAEDAPTSGSSDEAGVDAPQYKPSGSVEYENGVPEGEYESPAATTGGQDAEDYQQPANPGYAPGNTVIPHTPGATNPAFNPAY